MMRGQSVLVHFVFFVLLEVTVYRVKARAGGLQECVDRYEKRLW